ncbi:MAG TPA: ABC transporter permease [Jiangellaceae bacterium]
MTGIGLVARRELLAQVRSKGFLIGLAISAIIVAGLIIVPQVIGSEDSYTVSLTGDGSDELAGSIEQVAEQSGVDIEVERADDEAAARLTITDGSADAAVLDGEVIISDGGVDPRLEGVLQNAHAAIASQAQLVDAGLDPQQVQEALSVEPLAVELVAGSQDDDAREGIAFLTVIALFFLIVGSASMVAIGVVEEKSSRIVEILLIAVRPWQLLAGKIAAFVMLGLIQLAVIATSGFIAVNAVGDLGDLPPGMPGIVAVAFAGFLLGFLFYASAAAAFASLVSRQEEVNQVLTPMTISIVASYLVGVWALNSPDALAGQVLSVTPPFSALVMPVRVATGDAAGSEIVLAFGLMVAAVAGMLYLGGRIYERAVLRTGKRLKITEVLRREASPT